MYKYKVIINEEPVFNYNSYEFKDTNKNIIKINKDGITIEMNYNSIPKSNKYIINRCKKSIMLYLLKYKKIDSLRITDFYENR